MAVPKPPAGLRRGGAALWRSITKDHALDAPQLVQLEEACRAKDRLDQLDKVLRGEVEGWIDEQFKEKRQRYELVIDSALSKANDTANLMKQLLAALRLPDKQTGQRPQQRGGARGAYTPGGASEKDGDSNGSALGALRGIKGGKSA